MKYRKMDVNGDYVFGLNEQGFLKDNEAVAQAVVTKIKLLKGEWWEDVSEGTPFFQSILGINATLESKIAIDLIIRDRILQVENVETIVTFKSEIDKIEVEVEIDNVSRSYMLYCELETNFGELIKVEIEL